LSDKRYAGLAEQPAQASWATDCNFAHG